MYTITVDMPNLSKGAEVQIDGLGIVENGKPFEVSDEKAEDFRNYRAGFVDNYDDKGDLVDTKWQQGPTLLQFFQNDPNVKVMSHKTKGEVKGQQPQEAPTEQVRAEEGVTDNA